MTRGGATRADGSTPRVRRPRPPESSPLTETPSLATESDSPPRKARRASPPAADGALILFGFHSVTSRLRRAASSIRTLSVDADRQDGRMQGLLQQAAALGVVVNAVSSRRLDQLAAGRSHQGVVAEADAQVPDLDLDGLLRLVAAEQADGRVPILLLLDGVTDPRNLGACLRVADGAGVLAVLAPRDHSCRLTEVVVHTSSGGAESVPYVQVPNLVRVIDALQDAGFQVAGTADGATDSVFDADLSGPMAWVLGAEDKGLRRLVRAHCDLLVSIPMAGQCESLNVSVAAGIVLYETVRQRR